VEKKRRWRLIQPERFAIFRCISERVASKGAMTSTDPFGRTLIESVRRRDRFREQRPMSAVMLSI
jgi:hypothetical protein